MVSMRDIAAVKADSHPLHEIWFHWYGLLHFLQPVYVWRAYSILFGCSLGDGIMGVILAGLFVSTSWSHGIE